MTFRLVARLFVSMLLALAIVRPASAAPEPCPQLPSSTTPLVRHIDGFMWDSMQPATAAVASPLAEERDYLAAVGEIHGRVRILGSAIGMAMIMYDICEIDAEALGNRLASLHSDLDDIDAVLRGLHPTDRLASVQNNYGRVISLYREGVLEMDKTVVDGDATHFRDAFPLTNTASDGLADLEGVVWGS